MLDKSMKILQVNTEKTWRGGERQTLLTMKGLLCAGIQARLLCLEGHPLAKRAASESLPLELVVSQKQALIRLMRHGSGFDLIHAQTGKAQSLAVIARPFHQRRVLYTRRVDFQPRGLAAKLKYSLTSQVVAISPAIKSIVDPILSEREAVVIPSCIDTSRQILPASNKAMELKDRFPKHRIVATAAAMVPHKDPITMVRAVHELKKLAPNEFIFVHFGTGELEGSARQEARRLGLADDYQFMGFEPELEGFFPVFDVFVMSSREEGLGSSVLEAFRYGVPVVSTSAGGLKDLVTERGLVCAVQDYKCLARNIGEVLRHPERFKDMIQKARKHVLECHSLERMVRDYIRIYSSVLDRC